MDSGDADVVHTLDGVAHQFRRARGLFGHAEVGRAGCRNHDLAVPRCNVLLSEGDDRCIGVIRRLRHVGTHRLEDGLTCASD